MKRPFRRFDARPIATLRDWGARVPIDLVGVAVFTLVAAGILVVWNTNIPLLRAVVGFPLLFLAPGYALVSLLFPRVSPVQPDADTRHLLAQTIELSGVERAALSFGLSFAILPMLGLLIATVWTGFTQTVVVGVVSGFVLAALTLAAIRRLRVPRAERYRIDLAGRLDAARSWIVGTGSPVQVAVNIVLVCSMLIALTTVTYALVAPQDGEQYTGMQLLTEDDDGEYVAAGYPETLGAGESTTLTISVENQEGTDMEYTVVVLQEHVDDDGVVDREELDRFDYVLDDGVTGYGDRTVTPTAEDGTVRVSFLLYDDEVPDEPTRDNAYRSTYFWTEIEGGEE